MIMTNVEEKQFVRERMRSVLKSVPAERRRELSDSVITILQEQEVVRRATTILGYMALGDELNLFRLFEWAWDSGKTVLLPRYTASEQCYCAAIADRSMVKRADEKGKYGIVEPPASAPCLPLNRLDLALVPGLAFDPGGRRLGRGKGFYDRLLAEVAGVKCGVGMDEQLQERLPAETHDIAMNFIVTPTRWLAVPVDRTIGN
jgi:5-formyltetrahydrofolate cyclo-ligase